VPLEIVHASQPLSIENYQRMETGDIKTLTYRVKLGANSAWVGQIQLAMALGW
jgi:hypothetical protein